MMEKSVGRRSWIPATSLGGVKEKRSLHSSGVKGACRSLLVSDPNDDGYGMWVIEPKYPYRFV